MHVAAVGAKICVADWNGDGKPDLLVGDLVAQRTRETRDNAQKELEELRQQASALMARLPPASTDHGWVWLFLRK